MSKLQLRQDKTPADVLDIVERDVVNHMMRTRNIGEMAMRLLLTRDAEVRASYHRKCQRSVATLRAKGLVF